MQMRSRFLKTGLSLATAAVLLATTQLCSAYQFRVASKGIVGAPGAAAKLLAVPTSLDFGSIQVGQSSTASFTVSNTGTATATSLSLSPSAGYSVTGTCGSSLAVGAQCTEQVTFSPSVAAPLPGGVSVAANGTSASVSTAGVGQAASLAVSTSRLAFGLVGVNTQSTAQSFTVTNTGVGPITMGAISLPSGAAFVSNLCANAVLTAGASCTDSVAITPSALMAYSGAISITSSAGGAPSTIALSATGAQNDTLFAGSPGIYGGYNWWTADVTNNHTMLWNTATDNAPPGTVDFETLVPNPSTTSRHIQVFVAVDDSWTGFKVSGNPVSIASCTIGVQCSSGIVTIPPGNSRVNLQLVNGGTAANPAGAAMWVIDSDTGQILRDSSNNGDWLFTSTAF